MRIKILLLLAIILSSCSDELEVFHVDKVDDTGQVHVEIFSSNSGWWLTSGSKVNNYIRDLYNNTKHDETVVLVGRLTSESLAYDTIVKLKDVHKVEVLLNSLYCNKSKESKDLKDDSSVLINQITERLPMIVLGIITAFSIILFIAFLIVLRHKYKILDYIRKSRSTDLNNLKFELKAKGYDSKMVDEVINEINKELELNHKGYND